MFSESVKNSCFLHNPVKKWDSFPSHDVPGDITLCMCIANKNIEIFKKGKKR